MEWLAILNDRGKIAVLCSDVAGAFDRVDREILTGKLRKAGIHPRLIHLLHSWLDCRTAHVLVGGERSAEMKLKDQIFQGTVLGPKLWNIFYEDVKVPIQESGFKELLFADDLNS